MVSVIIFASGAEHFERFRTIPVHAHVAVGNYFRA